MEKQQTGVLAHHNTSGVVKGRGQKLQGTLTVMGVNGVLLRNLDLRLPMTFTGPVQRLSTKTTETIEVYPLAYWLEKKTPAHGVNIQVVVATKEIFDVQQTTFNNIMGH